MVGTKRTAGERAEGEPRLKRKRVEVSAVALERTASMSGAKDAEANRSLVSISSPFLGVHDIPTPSGVRTSVLRILLMAKGDAFILEYRLSWCGC